MFAAKSGRRVDFPRVTVDLNLPSSEAAEHARTPKRTAGVMGPCVCVRVRVCVCV